MNVEMLKNWEEYELRINDLQKEQKKSSNCPPLLFRGQANSEWKLITTLERYSSIIYTVESYNYLIKKIQPVVESYLDEKWSINEYKEDPNWPINPLVPNAEFVVYLRHIGFPSPLLDWSLSPYVAAFFAYNNANANTSKYVSIYTYWQTSVGASIRNRDKPYIQILDQSVKTHKRHYIQQSRYTFCRCFQKEKSQTIYCSHEEGFIQEPKLQTVDRKPAQDLLWCFKIPTFERNKVLEKLDYMNINAYTLFDTKEALSEVLARQYIQTNPSTVFKENSFYVP